jgi:hypothetical protein
MTREELISQLYDETLVGNRPAVLDLTNQGLPPVSALRSCSTKP